ncbi:MAG: carbamoyltransferase HypF [Planctomycetales bacterium]|nr:carbamoyltransferase HypF [Planctomycetales bacterium]
MLGRQRITIRGRVQGVGCRPFVYRLAAEGVLAGMVYNNTQGVTIEVQGQPAAIERFIRDLQDRSRRDYPALLDIFSIAVESLDVMEGQQGFHIVQSDAAGQTITQVTPDCATCPACLRELKEPSDFRYRYPFINCTHCGPRYSIVKTIPYDRPNTTMASFGMCGRCKSQYTDVRDRRFHAQPTGCPVCGPKIWLTDSAGSAIETDSDKTIVRCAEVLRAGGIAAVKGIGGFHLAVDALNESAVRELRKRKHRDAKPFALMAASVETVSRYAVVNDMNERLLKSPQAPIVLLDKKEPNGIAPSAAFGTHRFGFMLCYAPLHHLLFAQPGMEVLVMTSANLSDEPLICKNEQALEELGGIADVFLMHNRDIYRQVDDSVIHEVNGQAAFLRRARGYVPSPIYRSQAACGDIFAAGPDLKNTFCFVKGDQYLVSEHIGDLADGRVYRHYIRSVEHLRQLFRVQPEIAVCDLHPAYLSTHFAEQMSGVELIRVQHHWAHIASVLADCNEFGPVIGLVADGTGYGTDGAIWGCECLISTLTGFERFGHLAYYPLAGGDRAAKEAIRPLVGLLCPSGDFDALYEHGRLLSAIDPDADKIRLICSQIKQGINTVPTSSMGRLFDAVAALLGAGAKNRFEAELPMALEAMLENGVNQAYPIELHQADGAQIFPFEPVIKGVIRDIENAENGRIIAARFHNTICEGLLELAKKARLVRRLNDVALSGGVFCNRYLANRLIERLKQEQFRVLWKQSVPVNDGGICFGQAAIAAEMINKNRIG